MRYRTRCRKQRAVAAEDNDKIGSNMRQIFTLGGFAVRTELTCSAIRGNRVAMFAKPGGNLNSNLAQFRFPLLGDNGRFLHRNSVCSRNSLFPSIPRMGDSINSMFLPPNSSTFCRTFRTASC